MKKFVAAGFSVALIAAAPLAVQAHHSHAMFDVTKTEDIEGTVKAFNFANPHVYLFLLKNNGGTEVTVPIEMSFIQNMMRQGMTTSTFKPGDKVTIVANPLKNGNPGGMARSITGADGAKLGRQGG